MGRYVVFAGVPTTDELYASWGDATPPMPEKMLKLADNDRVRAAERSVRNEANAAAASTDRTQAALYSGATHGPPTRREDSQQMALPSHTYEESYLSGSFKSAADPQDIFPFELHDLTPLSDVSDVKGPGGQGLFLQILAFITSVKPLKHFDGAGSPRLELEVADEAGSYMTVVAWSEQAERLSDHLRVGDVVWLANLKPKRYEGAVTCNLSRAKDSTQSCFVCYRCDRRSTADDQHRPSLGLSHLTKVNRVSLLRDLAIQHLSRR